MQKSSTTAPAPEGPRGSSIQAANPEQIGDTIKIVGSRSASIVSQYKRSRMSVQSFGRPILTGLFLCLSACMFVVMKIQ